MKTTSLVLVALILVSDFTDASKKVAASVSGARKPRVNRLDSARVNGPPANLPVHDLLRGATFNSVIEQSATPFEDAMNSNQHRFRAAAAMEEDDDNVSLKSIRETDEVERVAPVTSSVTSSSAATSSSATSGFKRKRLTKKEQESIADAELLLGFSRSNESTRVDIDEQIRNDPETQAPKPAGRKIVVRKSVAKAPRAPRDLMEMSEWTFENARINNFRSYFDERNMQTAGNETLYKCFRFSHFLKLATYLVEKGGRFPEVEAEQLLANFSAVVSGGADSETSSTILMELLKYDPIGTVQMFIKVAGLMEQEVSSDFDTFVISLLMDLEVSFLFFASPAVPEVIQLLSESEMLSSSLNFICQQFQGDLDNGIVLSVVIKAIKSKNAALLETILEKGWIHVDDKIKIAEGKQSLTLISHLFSKFEAKEILRLIQKFNYPLNFTHNETVNPEGDILLSAVSARNLEAFKRLLVAGASVNINLPSSESSSGYMSLEELISSQPKYRAFHEALQEFRSGVLQIQLEAQDAADASAAVAMDEGDSIFDLTGGDEN